MVLYGSWSYAQFRLRHSKSLEICLVSTFAITCLYPRLNIDIRETIACVRGRAGGLLAQVNRAGVTNPVENARYTRTRCGADDDACFAIEWKGTTSHAACSRIDHIRHGALQRLDRLPPLKKKPVAIRLVDLLEKFAFDFNWRLCVFHDSPHFNVYYRNRFCELDDISDCQWSGAATDSRLTRNEGPFS